MDKKIHILLFYKYIEIKDPKKLAKQHLKECISLNLKGRILLAKEGINGSVSGTEEQIKKYKLLLKSKPEFSDIKFKEEKSINHPFKKMIVKSKPEIVTFKQNIDLKNTGKYLSPKEFLELYDEKGNLKDDVILIDARNDYESKVGKFKGAITPQIEKFRDFPKVVKRLEEHKNKKIVMYCTGGIHCEKASAYLKQQGFNNVSQLSGGIITFVQELPDTVWEGECFVFDKRLLSSIDTENKSLVNCQFCDSNCDFYRNCRNGECNLFVPLCSNCYENKNGCCSTECQNKFKLWCLEKARRNQNKKVERLVNS